MNYGINIEHGPCSFDDLPANNDLVGGFKHVFSIIYGMSSFPLTIFFSKWLLHHQPVMIFKLGKKESGEPPLNQHSYGEPIFFSVDHLRMGSP